MYASNDIPQKLLQVKEKEQKIPFIPGQKIRKLSRTDSAFLNLWISVIRIC